MKVLTGNLIDLAFQGYFDVIMHGCNCFCTMRRGIAKEIHERIPEAYLTDLRHTVAGDKSKLGSYTATKIHDADAEFTVLNCYTQYDYRSNTPDVDYEAIRAVCKKVKKNFSGKSIGFPKIGCGLAGGSWDIVSQIIEEELEGEDITYVEFSRSQHEIQ